MTSSLPAPLRRLVGTGKRLETGTRRAEVVAVAARKGGVGKTTTSVNLACCLASQHNLRVLLVDMDAQGHCASSIHQLLKGVAEEPLGEILMARKRDVLEVAMPTRLENLWVTPSDKELSHAETVIGGRIGKEFILRSALKVARTHFDLILLDCPPNLGTLTLNALSAADHVLIPCDMSMLALEGVDDIYDTLDDLDENLGHSVSVLGVLRTRHDGRNQRLNGEITQKLRSRYARDLLDNVIPVNTRLSQAQAEGLPVIQHDASCAGSQAYSALAETLVSKLGY